MKTNPNEPINPHKHLNCNGQIDGQYKGLTKREYFAAMAMQGFLSADGFIRVERVAEMSVKYADALINEFNKDKRQPSLLNSNPIKP